MKAVCHYLNSKNVEGQQQYQVASLPLTFNPGELKEIILSIVPKEEGELVIDGIDWEVENLVSGSYKMGKVTGKVEPVVVQVRNKAGQLTISTNKNLKLSYLDGEIDYYNLKMKNTGSGDITQITLITDFPILFGWKTSVLDCVLKPQEEKEITVYLRAGITENWEHMAETKPKILIRYQTNPCDSQLQCCRYKRIVHSYKVDPSFAIKNQCIRSYKNLNEYLLNVQIEKLYAKNEAFYLNELCCVGDSWKIIEKQQFTGFDKVFNTFISLIYSPNGQVELKSKKITLGKREKNSIQPIENSAKNTEELMHDTAKIEPFSNYIKEYQDARKLSCQHENLVGISVDILATWTFELGKDIIKGAHLLPITLSEFQRTITKTKESSKLDMFPLQIVHDCPNIIKHDFSKDS